MDWRKQIGLFHGAEKIYMINRNSTGKMAYNIAMAKACPKSKVVVSDLRRLDALVAAGVQPSQIIVAGEMRSGYSASSYELR